ncbi:MAG: threonine--tRNA ligase [Lachnospiraceae bacterium]|nr:threonine--tRNA ligase [Lachnospiraceae bacterium]
MIKVTLKDGSFKEYEAPKSIIEIAEDISEGLARNACAGELDGETADLRTIVDTDCSLSILTCNDDAGLAAYRHTTSHILAQAVKRLYPQAKLAIGPSIAEGFYYDFDIEGGFTPEDLEKIEGEMKKIIKEALPLERFTLPRDEAIKFMEEKDEPYKVELITDLPEDSVISFYKQGDFTDLCAGPHLMNTKFVKAYKLTSLAGAYWRGSEKNKMLTRIYGTAFPKKTDLEEYLAKLEEAKLRDHRKIGRELGLFMTDELVGKGMPMFLPKGYTLWRILENYIRDKELDAGYQHVLTPCVGTVELYKTSGHWEHYKDNMFPAMEVDDETYVLRPMNCPHHMRIYANSAHSYRNLPVRIGEIAHDFRYEQSGALKGIERGRHFCQNDAHLFVTPEQIKDEFTKVVEMIFDTYKDFGITDYRMVLSLRDPADKEKYHDDDEMWDIAENALRNVLNEMGLDYTEEIGEAAFYGPKLDVNVKPAVGAEYTLSTCQLDFCLPAKFNLTYIDKDSKERTPVVLHRAILGSLDRFMAYLIEETMGAFPVWLAPVQIKVLPISEKFLDYARSVAKKLKEKDLRVEVDTRNEKIGYKIREARSLKIPYMLIVGAKEEENGMVAVRTREDGDIGAMSLEELEAQIHQKIVEKSL